MMFSGKDIICFAGEDWWYHNPHSNLHIMKSFAKSNRVLFINSIGVGVSKSKDKFFLKKAANKLWSLLRYFKRAEPNIFVLTPLSLPLLSGGVQLINKINTSLLLLQIRFILFLLGFKDSIIWVCVPTVKDVALRLKKSCDSLLIYYCVDNIVFHPNANHGFIEGQEKELIKKANLAFFVNHSLVEQKKHLNKNTFFVSHGVDYEHFSKSQDCSLPEPRDIKMIKRPIVGYIGAIREIDFNLLRFLLKLNPDKSFVFIGEIVSDIPDLSEFKNLYFLGKKNYEILPNFIRHFSCCTIMYRIDDEFNKFRNPKKFIEYLATGKPVVSVKMPELEYYKDLVLLSDSFDSYHLNLQQVIFQDSDEAKVKRINFARQHTWDDVASIISQYIKENVKNKNC